MQKPEYPTAPKKPIPPKELKIELTRYPIEFIYNKDDDYNSIKKNSLLNDHLEYISLQDLINKLPKNIDFNNVLLIKDQYYKDVEFYFVIQNELSIEEQKQKYLKELEVYGEALLEWKEKIDQWEKDKIKHKKDLAEYEIWKNNEKIKSLK